MSQAFKPKLYLKPESEEQASNYLREHGERSRVIAGGTGIYEVAHRGLLSDVEALIDITKLNLSYVRLESENLRIGACTTMTSIAASEELKSKKEFAVILDSLKVIQPLQVKNVATIAGAICTALPFFDLPVALMALDASVVVAPGGKKIKVSDFIQGYFAVDLSPGEFIREVELPIEKKGALTGSAFQKFSITGDDWALVNCGSSLSVDDSGKITRVSLVYGGGVGEKPKRAQKIEKLLVGVRANDEERIKSILDENVAEEVEMVSDIRASSEYRIRLAKVLGRRAVLEAGRRTGASGGN